MLSVYYSFLIGWALLGPGSFSSSSSKKVLVPIQKGEEIHYKLAMNDNSLAQAQVVTSVREEVVQGKKCVKVDAKVTGLAMVIAQARHTMTSLIEPTLLTPYRTIIKTASGKEEFQETIEFNPHTKQASVFNGSQKQTFNVPADIHDALSGFFYLRSVKYDQLKQDQYIEVPVFWEGETKIVKFKYLGKRKVTTSLWGQIDAHVLLPVLPPIQGVEMSSIRLAISADEKQLPVKLLVKTDNGIASAQVSYFKKGTN